MRKKDENKKVKPVVPFDLPGLGWDLFSASGNLGYYLLYHDLLDAEDEERTKFD
ncbi:MAG: hypothetical protein J6B79_04665 [Clostridia bacterium]|nr:hypothetical protein [Clostridia bacterium]